MSETTTKQKAEPKLSVKRAGPIKDVLGFVAIHAAFGLIAVAMVASGFAHRSDGVPIDLVSAFFAGAGVALVATLGTCFCIFAVGDFDSLPLFMQPDFHRDEKRKKPPA